jgi:hypothetical protein
MAIAVDLTVIPQEKAFLLIYAQNGLQSGQALEF